MKKFFIDITRFNADRNLAKYEAIQKHFNLVDNVKDSDYILVLGGDGTLAEQVAKYKDEGKPFFPINGGTVGFHMQNIINSDGSFLSNSLKNIEEDNFQIELMPMIKVEAISDKGEKFEDFAFGDALTERKVPRCMRFNLCIEKEKHPMFCDTNDYLDGDGILMCTPTGSTAYYRNITNSIIPIGTECVGVAPINATVNKHRLNSFILDKKSKLHITLKDVDFRTPRLVLDGKEVENYIPKEITFSLSDRYIKILYLEEFFLHNKSLSYLMS